ncbi:hypothetical protein EON63_24410 [archaeon]|nr:MAG: hypothetical protein EON63_24410 [archaeon]
MRDMGMGKMVYGYGRRCMGMGACACCLELHEMGLVAVAQTELGRQKRTQLINLEGRGEE